MRIPLNDILAASECFRYLSFLKDSSLVTVERPVDISARVINKCYVRSSQSGFKASWRLIVGWVDKLVFRRVEVSNREAFDAAKKISEKVLIFLSAWYKKIYIPEHFHTVTDVPLEEELGSHVIFATAPIIKIAKYPTIVMIDDVAVTMGRLYNNIEVRGLQWMVAKALDCGTVAVEYLYMGKTGVLDNRTMYAKADDHVRTRSSIAQVASLISMKADWPSVTDQCLTCPFAARCKL